MVDFGYILRRLTFSLELKGVFPKIKYFGQELLSLSTRIRPNGIQQVTWQGPKGDLIINYYDSLACMRAEIIDLKMLDIDLPNKKDPLIIDIGANQGFASMRFKYNYPGAKIYAYEPVNKSFNVMLKNFASNKYSNIYAINAGVSDKNEHSIIYHVEGGAGLGDSVFEIKGNNIKTENILLLNPDKTFEDVDKIDLVKLDAEGSEYKILKNCKFWKKADKMIIEFHDGSKPDKIDYIDLIKKAGFKMDKKVGEGAVYVYYFSKIKRL
jgi:FkbM family methyltransferase